MKSNVKYWMLLALALLLTACGEEQSEPPAEGPYTLTVSIGESQDTLCAARSTAPGGETILYHLYENLLRWENDGNGWAVLAPGQAEKYTVETDFAGNATYTFTLRSSAAWSDGKPVTAADFVTAWQNLADPANELPHQELLQAVAGYDEVQETGDASRLSVSAPDDHTFVVTLNGSSAYFLGELCAGAYTMPVREELPADGTVTNGAYTAAEFTAELIRLERSSTYYNIGEIGPDELYFVPAEDAESDYAQFSAGTLDMVTDLPESVLREREESGDWIPEPVTSVYGVLLNAAEPPFDNPDVRRAFRLVTDTETIADELGGLTIQAAVGLVPYGVADYGEHLQDEEPTPPIRCWDFRTHSLEKVTVPTTGNYEENCRQAQRLLAQAGYPQGAGFPPVEYVYVESNRNTAAAKALRQMWQEQLGVSVNLHGMSQEEYDELLTFDTEEITEDGESSSSQEETPQTTFYMAAQEFTAAYNDATALLNYWQSENPENPTGYTSEAFDLLLQAARSAAAPDVQDALLHDAEAILLEDVPVIPVFYAGGSYQLADKWSGLYRGPNGVYFLFEVAAAS